MLTGVVDRMTQVRERALESRIDAPVDLLWVVHGRRALDGWGYRIYSAAKRHCPAVQRPDVWLGPIEGADADGTIGPAARWRMRVSVDAARYLVPGLRDAELDVGRQPGQHILRLGEVVARELVPAPVLHGLWVSWAFAKPGVGRSTPQGEWLRESIRAAAHETIRALGVTCRVRVGLASRLFVPGGWQLGCAVELDGLDDDESLEVQRVGLGARRRMGGGMLVPGPLPRALRESALGGRR